MNYQLECGDMSEIGPLQSTEFSTVIPWLTNSITYRMQLAIIFIID